MNESINHHDHVEETPSTSPAPQKDTFYKKDVTERLQVIEAQRLKRHQNWSSMYAKCLGIENADDIGFRELSDLISQRETETAATVPIGTIVRNYKGQLLSVISDTVQKDNLGRRTIQIQNIVNTRKVRIPLYRLRGGTGYEIVKDAVDPLPQPVRQIEEVRLMVLTRLRAMLHDTLIDDFNIRRASYPLAAKMFKWKEYSEAKIQAALEKEAAKLKGEG
jgi:hypothetical protein